MSIIRFFTSTDPRLHITEFGYSSPEKPREVGPWVRDTYILHIVTRGCCKFSEFTASEGEAFLISKDRLHSFEVTPPYEHYWFAFDGKDAPHLFMFYNISLQEHRHFKISNRNLAENILKTAFENAAKENSYAATQSAFIAMLPLLQTQDNTNSAQKDSRIQTVADFLDTYYAFRITVEQAASTVHLSEKYVCKKFKQRFGIPPQQYLLRARMQRAKWLLTATQLQIGEIAASVGYLSALNFSAAFKKHYGLSPSAFRKTV